MRCRRNVNVLPRAAARTIGWTAVLALVPAAVLAQGPQLQLEHLSRLADQASKVVDVTVDPAALQLAAGLLSSDKPQDVAIRQMLEGLKGVYVRSFEFDRAGVYTEADVDAVLAQLQAPWSRIVHVQENGERVAVYLYRDRADEKPEGLAVVVAEPRELTVVNIVGPIDLAQLGALGGQLGIPQGLGIQPDSPR